MYAMRLNGEPEPPKWMEVGRRWYCEAPEESKTSKESEPRSPRSCGECGNWWTKDGCHGICSVALGRFYDDEIENTPKYMALNITIDWALGNLCDRRHEACGEFEEVGR